MRTLKDISVAGALLVSFGTMAFAQQPMPGHGMMQHHPEIQKMMEDMMPQPSDAPSTRAFKEAHMKMMKGMSITFTGNANVDFARGMIRTTKVRSIWRKWFLPTAVIRSSARWLKRSSPIRKRKLPRCKSG